MVTETRRGPFSFWSVILLRHCALAVDILPRSTLCECALSCCPRRKGTLVIVTFRFQQGPSRMTFADTGWRRDPPEAFAVSIRVILTPEHLQVKSSSRTKPRWTEPEDERRTFPNDRTTVIQLGCAGTRSRRRWTKIFQPPPSSTRAFMISLRYLAIRTLAIRALTVSRVRVHWGNKEAPKYSSRLYHPAGTGPALVAVHAPGAVLDSSNSSV